MTPEDRLHRIDQLQRENAESLAAIEERERRRESNPIAEQDWLMADAEPAGGALIERQASGNGLLYRTHETPLPRVLQRVAEASDAGFDHDLIARALGEVVAHERSRLERKLSDLRGENFELRKEIADLKSLLLAKLDAADAKLRNLSDDVEAERAERRALEVEMAEQRGRTNAIVRDFVR